MLHIPALHIEHCCRILVDILCTDPAAQNQHKMPDSTRLHLLESFVCVVPSFVRQLDEDILQVSLPFSIFKHTHVYISDSTRLHLLEFFVCVVPSFVRQLDEDILPVCLSLILPVYTFIYICMYILYTHTHTHTHVNTYIHIHTYMHMYI